MTRDRYIEPISFDDPGVVQQIEHAIKNGEIDPMKVSVVTNDGETGEVHSTTGDLIGASLLDEIEDRLR